MSRKEWKACCCMIITITLLVLAIFFSLAFFIFNDMKNAYTEINDSYRAEQKIVEQMEQVIVDKNLEIDQLNTQIKELKEVK